MMQRPTTNACLRSPLKYHYTAGRPKIAHTAHRQLNTNPRDNPDIVASPDVEAGRALPLILPLAALATTFVLGVIKRTDGSASDVRAERPPPVALLRWDTKDDMAACEPVATG